MWKQIVLGAALAAGPEPAQNLDLGELAAALAIPIVTGGQAGNPIKQTVGDIVIRNQTAVTLVTVTNGKPPSVLATNFITPTLAGSAELILFTLDGTVGNLPVPRVKLGGFAYNDDEVAFDFSYEFDCFEIVALDEINANYTFDPDGALGLGSLSGHLELVPQPIAADGPDAHDAEYGDGNNSRKRGVHGWIVQNVEGTLVPANHPIKDTPPVVVSNGKAAWGRPLAQSTTALIPFLGDDDSTLDADTRE